MSKATMSIHVKSDVYTPKELVEFCNAEMARVIGRLLADRFVELNGGALVFPEH